MASFSPSPCRGKGKGAGGLGGRTHVSGAPMTPDQAIAFLAFAVVAAVTPGPSNIILASTGANAGVRRGLPCLLGVTLGMGLMMFAVAFGLGSVVLDRPSILTSMKWAGAALLVWLAWKIATSSRSDAKSAADLIGFRRA